MSDVGGTEVPWELRQKMAEERASYKNRPENSNPAPNYYGDAQTAGQGVGVSTEVWASQLFRFRAPTIDQLPKLDAIRDAASHLATVMARNCPQYSDKFRTAIEHLQSAVMFANKAVVNE